MPTTPVYALPYPAASAAPNVPLDMQALAERVELVISQQPAVRVYHNAVQSVTSTEVTLAFNSERFDQAFGAASTQHDTATNPQRLTCRHAGIYQISGNAEWASNPGASGISVKLNGSTKIASAFWAAECDHMSISTLYALAVNDYVELCVIKFGAGTINIAVSANYSPEFMMARVG